MVGVAEPCYNNKMGEIPKSGHESSEDSSYKLTNADWELLISNSEAQAENIPDEDLEFEEQDSMIRQLVFIEMTTDPLAENVKIDHSKIRKKIEEKFDKIIEVDWRIEEAVEQCKNAATVLRKQKSKLPQQENLLTEPPSTLDFKPKTEGAQAEVVGDKESAPTTEEIEIKIKKDTDAWARELYDRFAEGGMPQHVKTPYTSKNNKEKIPARLERFKQKSLKRTVNFDNQAIDDAIKKIQERLNLYPEAPANSSFSTIGMYKLALLKILKDRGKVFALIFANNIEAFNNRELTHDEINYLEEAWKGLEKISDNIEKNPPWRWPGVRLLNSLRYYFQ